MTFYSVEQPIDSKNPPEKKITPNFTPNSTPKSPPNFTPNFTPLHSNPLIKLCHVILLSALSVLYGLKDWLLKMRCLKYSKIVYSPSHNCKIPSLYIYEAKWFKYGPVLLFIAIFSLQESKDNFALQYKIKKITYRI